MAKFPPNPATDRSDPAPSGGGIPDPRAVLMRELAADSANGRIDANAEAVLRWDLARRNEEAGDTAGAVKGYLVAYNLDPSFRPPLDALVRIFVRRRSFKNLARLLEAQLKSARSDGERASALLDLAAFSEDHDGNIEAALTHLRSAVDLAPESAAVSLQLERLARSRGDAELTAQALELRSRATFEPSLRGVLLHEVAKAREDAGDADGAMAALDDALAIPAVQWRSYEALERISRRLGRPADTARALEGMAELALAHATTGTDPAAEQTTSETKGSGAFSIDRFADEARATNEAVACLYDAAVLRLEHADDPAGAAETLARATRLRPGDLLLRRARIEALRRAGDLDAVAAEAEALLENGLEGETAAALVYEVALAMRRSDPAAATDSLRRVIADLPHSIAALATLEAWVRDEPSTWVSELERRGTSGGTRGALSLWRAALLAGHQLGDLDRADRDFQAAALAAEDPTPILRDHYEEALRAGRLDTARGVLEALLGRDLEPEERGALLADRVRLAHAHGDDAGAAEALVQAMSDEAAASWAPDAARVHAAETGDLPLLAKAHLALAESALAGIAAREGGEETSAAHLAGAARASARAGSLEEAEKHLERALDLVPGHRYSVALLEEIYRAGGRADRVVGLLRRAADAQAGPRARVITLLLAGAAAEAGGNHALAAETYEQAADHDSENVSPLWALWRLAQKTSDESLTLRALEALSGRELSQGQAGRATLALGEHYAFHLGKPELAEGPLQACLESEDVAPEAAFALATVAEDTQDPRVRVEALERLAIHAPVDARALRRDAGITALAAGFDPATAETLAESLAVDEPDDRFALLTKLLLGPPEDRSELWSTLSQLTDDTNASDALALHGLRSMIVTRGGDATDDAFLLAQEISGNDSYGAIVAVDETLEASDDPDARFQALRGRLQYTSPETRSSLRAATGRAASAARREEALSLLRAATEEDPGDLASWEALRMAGRDAAEWEDVTRACDILAAAIEGEAQHELLEESAAVLMDHLQRDADAEERLRRVVASDPRRPNAYHRLHDLVAERGDTEELLQLVGNRIDALDDASELERLFYEMARLHRSRGELDQALEAIENVRMLDENHVGGMALEVEIHVASGQWAEAVQSLRDIAEADVPDRQKRVSLLGAADFLDKKLNDPAGAVRELLKLEALGLVDASLYSRMADLAQRAEDLETAVRAHLEAADRVEGAARTDHLLRAGAIQREGQGDAVGALLSYRQALSMDPVALEPARAVADLLPTEPQREAHSEEYEAAVRAEMAGGPLEPADVRKIIAAAEWRGDRVTAEAMLALLITLEVATDEEHYGVQEATAIVTRSEFQLDAGDLEALWDGPAVPRALNELVAAAHEPLCAVVGLDPVQMGVGRGDLVPARQESDLRNEIFAIAGGFGLAAGDFYHGGDSLLLAATPGKRERTDWILGRGVDTPMLGPAHRFAVGRKAFGAATHTSALIDRSASEGATLLFAVAAAADTPLNAGVGRPGLDEWTRTVQRTISRRARKATAAAATLLEDGGISLEGYCGAARRSANRAGLIACMDLPVALTALLGVAPTLEGVRASSEANALVRFWISREFLALRQKLGLA